MYLDGRKPTQRVLDDPTYAGYSTGHWEGDTLVVDTVALNDITSSKGSRPTATDDGEGADPVHGPGLLKIDRRHGSDALTKPWEHADVPEGQAWK